MHVNVDNMTPGDAYILKRDFIQTPIIRHNFGTEVVFLGHISSDREKVMVKVKGTVSGGFMVPISILTKGKPNNG